PYGAALRRGAPHRPAGAVPARVPRAAQRGGCVYIHLGENGIGVSGGPRYGRMPCHVDRTRNSRYDGRPVRRIYAAGSVAFGKERRFYVYHTPWPEERPGGGRKTPNGAARDAPLAAAANRCGSRKRKEAASAALLRPAF